MASASMDAVIRAEHRSPTDPRSPGPKPFAPGAGAPTVREEPGFGVGEPRFRCRSTALGAKGSRARAPSHPGRVLLRCGESSGLDVGESRFGCRSTALGAKRESNQNTFAPGAGAPTVREEPRF